MTEPSAEFHRDGGAACRGTAPAACGSRANPTRRVVRGVAGMVSVGDDAFAGGFDAGGFTRRRTPARRSPLNSEVARLCVRFQFMACGFCVWNGFRFRDNSLRRGGATAAGSLRRPAYIIAVRQPHFGRSRDFAEGAENMRSGLNEKPIRASSSVQCRPQRSVLPSAPCTRLFAVSTVADFSIGKV